MTDLVSAIDVSSAQPRDLSTLILQHQPQHVVVKLYQTIENIPQQYSLDQLASAQANGCSVGGYVWLYGSVPLMQQVGDALDLAERAGITLPILWIDCETYRESNGTTTYPTQAQALQAVQACEARGVRAGIYTGNWFVEGYWGGNVGELASRPVWLAAYDDVATLETPSPYWPRELVLGHQYDSTPIDQDVFDPSVTTTDPAPSQPSYEELQTIIGWFSHDLMDGFESEANRHPIRKGQLLALVEMGRQHGLD